MQTKRRLSDKILEAHMYACEVGRTDVAECLLRALEVEITAFGGLRHDNRNNTSMLDAAFEALEKARKKT